MLVTRTTQTCRTKHSVHLWVWMLPVAGLLLLLGGATATAQGLAEVAATTAITGELATGSAGGAMGPLGVGRATNAANMMNARNPMVMPQPGMGRMGGGPMGYAYPGMRPGGYMMPGMAPAPGPGEPGYVPPFQYTAPTTYRAIEGRRVYDAVSYRLNPSNAKILDDPQRREILEDKKDKYSDRGNNDKGDQIADDGLYSSILPPSTDEYTGGFSHFYALKSINVLRSAQALDVIDFFGLNAVTNDRFSSLEKERDKIADRDDRIFLTDSAGKFQDCWAKRFLDNFRIEQANPKSDFLPLYIPRPPAPPAVAPPTGWVPPQAVKTPDEMAVDSSLKKYKAAMGKTMSEADLEKKIKELRQMLLMDPQARQTFFAQFPPDVAPGTGGMPGMPGMPGMGMAGMPTMGGMPGMYGPPGGSGGMRGGYYNPGMVGRMTGGGSR